MIRSELEAKVSQERIKSALQTIERNTAELRDAGFSDEEIKRVTDPLRAFAAGIQEELDAWESKIDPVATWHVKSSTREFYTIKVWPGDEVESTIPDDPGVHWHYEVRSDEIESRIWTGWFTHQKAAGTPRLDCVARHFMDDIASLCFDMAEKAAREDA